MKKYVSILLVFSSLLILSACSNNSETSSDESEQLNGSVIYFNSDPDLSEQWNMIAEKYTEETGVPVVIQSVPDSDYSETLTQMLNSESAPTLFDVHSIAEFKQNLDFCYDLTGAKVLNQLITNAYSLSNSFKWNAENGFSAVGYSLTSCGLLYNKKIMEQAGYHIRDIQNYSTLQHVITDIQSRREELGLVNAVAPIQLSSTDRTSDFYSNLYNVAAFPYLEKNGFADIQYIEDASNVMQNLCDLLSVSGGSFASSTDVNGFINGNYVFCFSTIDSYNNDMRERIGYENLGILPLYTGSADEDKQGLCTNAVRYWCVNKNADKDDISATLDFLSWIAENEYSNNILEFEMGIHTPFVNSATSTNPLVASMIESLATRKNPMVNYLDVGFDYSWIR